jgi:hypothetical protein
VAIRVHKVLDGVLVPEIERPTQPR